MSTRKRSQAPDSNDPVTGWARDVVAGRIVAGQTTIATAERHLRDLRDGPRRGLHWDLAAALHVINWYPTMLTITGGQKVGEPFHLLPPHMFATGSLFGWKRADGRRRFRRFWFETGKGQAKSPWMAATGLYLMRFSGTPRFEGYAVAGTENQAGIIIADAAALCRASVPGEDVTLKDFSGIQLRGTGDLVWQIEWDGSEEGHGICKFCNVANGSAISGPKPTYVAVDEVHEITDRSILSLWESAINKMAGDPLMVLGTNTPAADQLIGTEQSDYYTAVAKGEVQDDSSLSLICTCDETDDPLNDETVWPKALPALGITYPLENVRDAVIKARGMPADQVTLQRLFFGQRVGAADAWIDLPLWESVLGKVTDEDVKGLPCWLGLDLSSRVDLTALAAVWRTPDEKLLARVAYWTPGATLKKREEMDRAPYSQWVEMGHLVATPGPTIPKSWPARQVKALTAAHDVQALAYDPAQILDFEEAAADADLDLWRYQGPDGEVGDGLMMINHGQGWKGLDNPAMLAMPNSVKALTNAILNGDIIIQTNPVTNYCSSNMALKPGDNPDMKVPSRRKSRARIDGMVALIMAVGAAMSQREPAGNSVSIYDMPEIWQASSKPAPADYLRPTRGSSIYDPPESRT